jgi:hypothetical protein
METVRSKLELFIRVELRQNLNVFGKIFLVAFCLYASGCAINFPNLPVELDKELLYKTCNLVPLPKSDQNEKQEYGPEDITVSSGIAYISSNNRRNNSRENTEKIKGGIYRYPFVNGELQKMTIKNPLDKTGYFDEKFYPHGISLYENPKGKEWLFVINKRNFGEDKISHVEVFEILGNELIFTKSIPNQGQFADNLNDLVAINEKQFYATSNKGVKSQITGALLGWGFDELVFYDGSEYHSTLAKDIAFANGINYNSEKKLLIISSSVGRKIRIYKEKEPGTLEELKPEGEEKLKTSFDNLEWENNEKTTLLVAAHPSLIDFFLYSFPLSFMDQAPSQVFKFSIETSDKTFSLTNVKEIYSDDGHQISASSVAVLNGNKLLLGSVFDHMLACN